MTRTTFYTATTLDGYLADEHDSLDWLLSQDIDGKGPMNYDEFIADVGAIAMGASTYEWLLANHVDLGNDWGYEMPTWVFTHRDLRRVADNITFTQAPVAEVHATMAEAAQGKDIWMAGGGDLAAQFAAAGLLDELIVSIAPVLLGAGKPLFTRQWDLELREFDRNGAFLCARYAVSGPR